MKALPKRLCISIGGFFGPCYEVTFKKCRLTYTYLSSRDLRSQELEPAAGTAPATAPRGDTAFAPAMAEFPADARQAQRLVLAT
jgi:hypothetical protein